MTMKQANIAIIAHVYYADLWPELSRCIANVRKVVGKVGIYITVPEKVDERIVLNVHSLFPSAEIMRLPNRGFDVGPFIYVLKRIRLDAYEYVFKLHTKRNRFGIVNFWPFFGGSWRRSLLSFCATPTCIMRTLDIFKECPCVGMVGSGMLMLNPTNELVGRFSVSGSKDVKSDVSCDWCFIAGTMFAVRANILEHITQRFSFESFPLMVGGSHDNGLAHEVERELGHEVYRQGFRIESFPKRPLLFSASFRFRRAIYGVLCSCLRLIVKTV